MSTPLLATSVLDGFDQMVLVSRFSDLRVVYANRTALEVLGWSAADIAQKTVLDLAHPLPDDLGEFHAWAEGIRGGKTWEGYAFVRNSAGDLLPVRTRIYRLDSEGEECFVSVASRLGPVPGGQGELSWTWSHFGELLQSAPVGIFVIDAAARMVFENHTMLDLMGVPRGMAAPVLGKVIFDIPSVKGHPIEEVFRQVARGESVHNFVSPYVSLMGKELTASINGVPLYTEAGEPDGALFVVLDVTEQRRMEGEVQKAQRLESLGVLAGGLAHDFNNILEAINGSVALAELALPPDHSAVPRLRAVEKMAHRAGSLVSRLMNVVRRKPLDRQIFDLGRRMRESQDLLVAATSPHVLLEIDASEGPLLTEGNPDQIDQVLLNLAINARDAMPSGGRLRISLHPIRSATHPPTALLEVEDSGVGIPPDHLDRIFDPYFTTKGPQGGTGLGLAVVYNVVTNHGGRVEVDSQPGRGTLFRIWLPLADPPLLLRGDRSSPPASGALPASRPTILLVEDEPALRVVFQGLLEQAGYRVRVASRGGEALLALAEEANIAALVADFQLPDMSGTDVVRHAREMNPRLPVIISTGYAREDVVAPWLLQPGVRFLQKPFAFRRLREVLAELLDPDPEDAPTLSSDEEG